MTKGCSEFMDKEKNVINDEDLDNIKFYIDNMERLIDKYSSIPDKSIFEKDCD